MGICLAVEENEEDEDDGLSLEGSIPPAIL